MNRLFSYILKWYFPIFIAITVLVYALQMFHVQLPTPINNYLNDFLCMPIVLKMAQLVVRYVKSDAKLQISLKLQLIVVVIYAAYFEWYLPQFNPRYTADVVDVLAYFLGFMVFNLLESAKNTDLEKV